MLHALGFPDDQMPKFLVHGWWNISGAKMSKSLGNVIDPDALADKYGAEALRYYLMSDMVTGRTRISWRSGLSSATTRDLANSLGNLLNRTLNMAARYRGGRLRRGKPTLDLFKCCKRSRSRKDVHERLMDDEIRRRSERHHGYGDQDRERS